MDWTNPRSVETRIKRLTNEINEIENYLYSTERQTERSIVASVLEHQRDDLVRGAVLQVHTTIEDLMNQVILYCALGITEEALKSRLKGKKAKAIQKMLYGAGSLGFDMKLNLAVGLGLLTVAVQKKLMELNTIRNRCSHNWRLNVTVRRGRRPKQTKPPLLEFRGHDLHKIPVLKEFLSEYTGISSPPLFTLGQISRRRRCLFRPWRVTNSDKSVDWSRVD